MLAMPALLLLAALLHPLLLLAHLTAACGGLRPADHARAAVAAAAPRPLPAAGQAQGHELDRVRQGQRLPGVDRALQQQLAPPARPGGRRCRLGGMRSGCRRSGGWRALTVILAIPTPSSGSITTLNPTSTPGRGARPGTTPTNLVQRTRGGSTRNCSWGRSSARPPRRCRWAGGAGLQVGGVHTHSPFSSFLPAAMVYGQAMLVGCCGLFAGGLLW